MESRSGIDPLCVLIGKHLRRRREDLGMSQAELAAAVNGRGAAGWTAATVSGVETGRRNIRLSELADVIDILQSSFHDALSGRPFPTGTSPDMSPDTRYRVRTLTASTWRGDSEEMHVDMRPAQRRRLEENVWGSLTDGRHPTAAERATLEAASQELFGRDLLEEREARVSSNISGLPRLSRARAGHATRGMIADLKKHLTEKGVL